MPSGSTITQTSSAPPIPRWGLTPFEDEPAHAFFLRLAALNGQHAIPAYAMSLGLNGRNIDPQQMLHFCEQLPIQQVHRLRSATPSIAKQDVLIRGEHLRLGFDWSIRQRRYCYACLKEAEFHRFWFDLPIIRVCPYHRTTLDGAKGGMKWAWYDPLPSSVALTASSVALPSEIEGGVRFSEYILGRLGSLPPSPLPQLEGLRLSEAVYLCSVIGRLVVQGWTPLPTGMHDRRVRQRLIESGFQYLAKDGSVTALLEAHLESSPYNSSGACMTRDMQTNLGWLYDVLRSRAYRRQFNYLMEEVTQLLAKRGGCRPLKRKFPIADRDRRVREVETNQHSAFLEF